MPTPAGSSLLTAIGGAPMVAVVVDALYVRLTTDPVVGHHFHPDRLESLKAAQRAWFTAALSGAEHLPTDLAAVHAHLDIGDAEIDTVIGHLEAILVANALPTRTRTAVLALVARLWYARRF